MSLLGLFVEVDDFCSAFERWAAAQQLRLGQNAPYRGCPPGKAKRGPAPSLSASEVMTIVIHFHQAGYRDFKSFYQKHVCEYLVTEFPKLVSYGRFTELMSGVALLLCAYLHHRFGYCTGIAFVDSTPLVVCHIERAKPGPLGLVHRRISRNSVFKNLVARGKSTMGWFYGFKLHLIVNEQGELLAVHLTPGNTDDRKPLQGMSKNLFGKLFGDKGYLSQALFETLFERGLELITSLRKNMKGQPMLLSDKLLLRKRFISVGPLGPR